MSALDTQVAAALRSSAERTIFVTEAERAADSTLSVPDAARFLGVPEDAVRAVVADGAVPVVAADDGPELAYHDVAALGLNSRLDSSVPEMGLSMMMRFARQSAAALTADLRWSFSIRCASEEAAVLRVPLAGAEIRPAAGTAGVDGWTFHSAMTGTIDTHGIPGVIRNATVNALYDELLSDVDSGRLVFQWVTPLGRTDPYARWRERRLDCVCLAEVASAELHRAGIATRLESGRVLGVLDAQHTWLSVHDDDGVWKRFDPLLESHCHRLWGDSGHSGSIFRGAVTNALIGWAGTRSSVVAASGSADVGHTFLARRVAA
jgi:hypothetical protein